MLLKAHTELQGGRPALLPIAVVPSSDTVSGAASVGASGGTYGASGASGGTGGLGAAAGGGSGSATAAVGQDSGSVSSSTTAGGGASSGHVGGGGGGGDGDAVTAVAMVKDNATTADGCVLAVAHASGRVAVHCLPAGASTAPVHVCRLHKVLIFFRCALAPVFCQWSHIVRCALCPSGTRG